MPCPDSGDSIGNGIDYCVWTWVVVVFLSSSPHARPLIADRVARRSTQADKTNVWLELWGCWIAMLSVLNDSW